MKIDALYPTDGYFGGGVIVTIGGKFLPRGSVTVGNVECKSLDQSCSKRIYFEAPHVNGDLDEENRKKLVDVKLEGIGMCVCVLCAFT